MEWYQNPSIAAILGAVAGAIITGGLSLYLSRKTRKVKRIECIIEDVASLLTFSEKIEDKLNISFEGSTVSSVYRFSLRIASTGNEAIRDQPINIRLEEGAEIVDYSINTKPEVGFGYIQEVQQTGNILDLNVELMNPGDKLDVEVLSLQNKSDEIGVYLKNENVQDRVYTRNSADKLISGLVNDRQMLIFTLLSALPFMGGYARSLMTLTLANKVDKIAERQEIPRQIK